MSISASKRKWYRLHASTWVLAVVTVGVLVLLVVPGVEEEYGFTTDTFYQHGWPWPFLENSQNYYTFGDEEKVPWLRARAWQFFYGDVAWGLLAADAACALAITAGVTAAWEWRRRRRVRLWHLTLSELLLATLLVACSLGWWQINAREAARQESFAWVLANNGSVASAWLGPAWLYRLTGQTPTGFYRVTEVDVDFSAEAVRSVSTLKHIEKLDLYLKGRSPAGGELAPLRDLPRLRRLSMTRGEIGEENGAVLAGLPALRVIAIENCDVSTEGLAQLQQRGHVEELILASSAMSEDWLKHIARMHSLKRLSLYNMGVTDAGVAQLARMTGLKQLSLNENSSITDAGLRHLPNITELEDLDLSGTKVTKAGCQELSRHLPQCKINVD